MIGVSSLIGNPDGEAADVRESGGASGGSSEIGPSSSSVPSGRGVEDSGGGGGGGGGNRWPRQETLALLKIRSEMDAVFRESSLKGPLWLQVSRKMAELGFQRNAKKCKEKFENLYKYHKRTKDGRSSKSDGKTYRFFDQLQALENATPPASMAARPLPTVSPNLTVPSPISPNPVSMALPAALQPPPPPPTAVNISNPMDTRTETQTHPPPPPQNLFTNRTTSSSTSSDEDIQRRRSGSSRKRKWKVFFQRLMKDVIQKQEELQKMFVETLEKRERDRTARDEAWRMQERSRLNREHELLVQERSMAAAKDAAVIAFLQKVTDQQNLQIPISLPIIQETPQPPPPPPPPPPAAIKSSDKIGDNSIPGSSSRWPKAEIEALINLRTNLDLKYQDTGPKGPLWEEVSSSMAKIGYNRSSKRCKEKWENINKYFKKVKESSKHRSEDSKTCPYFHQLDAIYKERGASDSKPENQQIMARQEQQLPLSAAQPPLPQDDSTMDPDRDDDDGDDGDGGDEEEDQGYGMVGDKLPADRG